LIDDADILSSAVNGVCFADENSTNVIVSASDDGFLKVWYVGLVLPHRILVLILFSSNRDRRSIGSSVPSGVLVGHTQGITFVDPKGDGRYVISNGKDQAIRLWDLRKMRGWNEVAGSGRDAAVEYGIPDWDYR
jgi:WD repeat-containing protein 23